MNSTRWVTLTEFVKHLGRSGVARVDETEKGWFIAWIDSSPKALAKAVSFFISTFTGFPLSFVKFQEASLKKDRATMSDEQRERQLITEQIERAKAGGDSESPPPEAESQELKRDENTEKVILSLSVTSATPAAPSGPTGLKINPLKVNPLKRPNVFKTATVGGSSSSVNADRAVNDKKRPAAMSAAERLILEEQERKRRRMDRDNAV